MPHRSPARRVCRDTTPLATLVACLLALAFPGGLPAQVLVSIGQNFTGNSFGDVSQSLPPDTDGRVGPNHFVEFLNGVFSVYDKSDGANILSLADIDFWSQAGVNVSSASTVTDPRIIYDPTCQRWFASMVQFNTTSADPTSQANNFLLAVSQSSDPTGTWHGFWFRADPTSGRFADFPTLGVDNDAVYIAGDFYHYETNPIGPGLVSIPKAELLLANPTNSPRTWTGVMSYDSRGEVLQPVICFDGSVSGMVLSVGDIGYDSDPHSNLVAFAVLNAASANATLSPPTSITVSPYEVPMNPDLGVPLFTALQPDGTTTLQANDARLSASVYAVNGVLYAVHSTLVDGRIAIRWYRIDAATRTLLESGTVTDPDLDLFFPSIAANPAGVVVLAYNGSSLNTFISAYARVGRTVNGVTSFGDPLLLQSGLDNYHDLNEVLAQLLGDTANSRWGDYSTLSVDPVDPNRFWSIQAYPGASDPDTGAGIWSTQITEILTAIPALSSTLTNGDLTVSWPGTAIPFALESTTNLLAPNSWTTVNATFTTNNGLVSYQPPTTNAAGFFRLRQL